MSALAAATRAELLRLRRWPALWVLLGVWILMNLMFVYVFNFLSYRNAGDAPTADGQTPAQLLAEMMPGNVPLALVQGMPLFGGAILLILGALSVGSGYGWGTWKTVLTQGPGRVATFGGTLLTLTLIVVGVVLGTAVIDVGAANLVAAVESQPLGLPAFAELARGIGAGILILGMWTAGGVLVGVLTKGPALAVGLGLVWALVVENLLRGVATALDWLAVVTDHLPGTAAGSLVGSLGGAGQAESGGTPGVVSILGGGTSSWLLAGYLVAFLVAAMLLVRRRDLT